MKKLVKWVLIGFVGLVVLGAIVGGGEEETADQSSSGNTEPVADVASAETEAVEEEVAEESDASAVGIGETIQVGDIAFTVSGKSTADTVGDEWVNETATGLYLVIDISAENKGNEAVMIDSSYFKLKQGDTVYDPDSMATTLAEESTSFFLENVNPNMALTGKLVFDIPADVANAEDLILEVADGMFLAETGEILLK